MEGPKDPENSPDTERNQALMEISVMMSNLHRTGATDTEPQELQKIIDALRMGKITSQEALEKARKIIESRQEYH